MSGENGSPVLPLGELKVVELGHFVAGPYCARLLADAGAEVIKVESPEGDESRRRGPFAGGRPDPNASGLFLYLNSNKRAITLNVQSPDGRRVLHDLLVDADILVENHRPTELEPLGLDYPNLHRRHPRLIVTSISPFGQTGPYRDYRGDDLIAVNMGGLAYATPGLPDRVSDPASEPPLRPATHVADYATVITTASATMLALMAREWDGMGRHVDVSEQETVASTVTTDLAASSYLGLAKLRGKPNTGLMPNDYLPCEDGYVALTAITQEHWLSLVRLLLLDWTMSHTAEDICRLTQAQGLPCFAPNDVNTAVSAGHVAERGFLRHIEARPGHTADVPGIPFRLG